VLLFIVVYGIFPFLQSTKSDKFYALLCDDNPQKYWKAVGATGLSTDFKNLVESMLNIDPNKRPTIE